MDEGGVDAAVIQPPALDPNSTALALQAVRDYPRRFAITGAHDLLFQPPNGSSGAWAVIGGSMRATIETGRLWRLGGGSANVPCWHSPDEPITIERVRSLVFSGRASKQGATTRPDSALGVGAA